MKVIWKNLASRIWLIVTAMVAVVAIVINVLTSVTFYDAVCLVAGRPQTIIVGEETSRYEKDFQTKAEAYANGAAVSAQICEEGFVLLKNQNNALPIATPVSDSSLTKSPGVSVFGKNSVSIATSGSGSAGTKAADVDIFDSLTAAGYTYNQTLVDFYNDDARSGAGRTTNPDDLDSGDAVALSEGETPLSDYDDSIWSSCSAYSDLAIIVITRIGGEGFDLPRTDTSHFLQLSDNEKALIERVTSMDFGCVMLMLNTSTTMELGEVEADDGVDAILWTGFAGGNGMTALGEILNGSVTPSGKTVDTWAADFTHSPVWENFGAAFGTTSGSTTISGDAYTTSTTSLITGAEQINGESVYFVDYEEGIYVGYRYYETAYAQSVEQGGDYDFVYDDEVVYPFGYGLSYTEFEWTLENEDQVQNFSWGGNSSFTVRVNVKNTGDYAGREVVQLYVTPPYYGYKKSDGSIYGIEKSAKVLVGFAKTDILQPGDDQTVEITVESPYAFASYDYNDANENGFMGYEVEAGDYIFSVSHDSHNAEFEISTSLAQDMRYETDPVTGTAVVNLYTGNDDSSLNSDEELGSVLSRADFAGTWPARRTAEEKDRNGQESWLDAMQSTASNPNRPEYDDVMPVTGANNGITLSDLIGISYEGDEVLTADDTDCAALIGKTATEAWNLFLDQLTLSEMTSLINNGAFHTEAISRLGVVQTTESDGAFGFVNFLGDTSIYDTCVYPCAVIVSSTWNVDRAYDFGKAIGNEGLIGNEDGDGAPYSGIYAPGLNIHRSPFGGRNCEYYSEDCFISGMMAAGYIEGAASKGVFVTLKHFALNDQETHRSVSGLVTWATEQSMREIYLKSFETAIKAANSYAEENNTIFPMGVMSSFNRIGQRWTGGDYRLLTTILRDEWGFRGLVISDFNTNPYMVERDMFYAGGDLDLQILGIQWSPDPSSATDVTVARTAAKNILYTVANSNAMRGDFVMMMPVWQIIMFVVDGVVGAGLVVWGFVVIRRALKKAKHDGGDAK